MGWLSDPREELSKRHGVKSYAELLANSTPLPKLPGDASQSYGARHPRGDWLVSEEPEQPHAKDEDD